MRDARDVVMSDFYIESTPAESLFTAIQSENGLRTFYAPSQNHFRHFIINGSDKGGKTNGFRLAKGASGLTGTRWPILMQGIRFASDNFPNDGIILDVQNPGPLILKNNLFGNDLKAKMPRVRMNTTQHGAKFISQGNLWRGLTRFTDGDMVPPLQFGTFYRTDNSGPTVISNFRNGWPGQKLDILIEDSYTGFDFKTGTLRQNSGRLWRASKRDSLECIYDGHLWRCRPSKQ